MKKSKSNQRENNIISQINNEKETNFKLELYKQSCVNYCTDKDVFSSKYEPYSAEKR